MTVRILKANTPTLLLNANPRRAKLTIYMQAQSVDANNTGRVHIGFGFQPVAQVGHPAQGEILVQTAAIEEPRGNEKLHNKYKQAIWATADTDNQSIVVEELTDDQV